MSTSPTASRNFINERTSREPHPVDLSPPAARSPALVRQTALADVVRVQEPATSDERIAVSISLLHRRNQLLRCRPASYLSSRSSTSLRSFRRVAANCAILPVAMCTSKRMLSFLGLCGTISHASHRPPFVSTA